MTIDSKYRTGTKAAPSRPAGRARYGDDLYGWVGEQISLLKAGRLSEIDIDNIAEELSDVGNEQYDKLESAIRVVLLHLLKWDHQPSHRSKSWVLSVREHRRRIERVLRKNPSLNPSIDEAMGEAYEDALDDAMRETDLPSTAFPITCAYDWETILKRTIEFDDLRSPEG
jgi:hypothetical protein